MTELNVTIGADASDLIRETRRARDAYGRFTKGVTDDTRRLTKEVNSLLPTFQRIGTAAADAAKAVRDSFSRGGFSGVLADASKGVQELINDFGGLSGVLTSGLSAGFSAVAAGARAAVGAFQAATAGAVALTAALVGIGAKATSEFARFQNAFGQVRTLIDESQVDVARLEDGVRSLATTFGVDLQQATQAAYQAISAGVDPARTVEFLETAFKGAAAGAAEVAEVTDLVTSALNAFNLPVSEATRVSDVFFTTVRLGKTTITELSDAIGQVAPIASAAGVELQEVGAAFATLTASGLSTAEAATQIRAAIAGILRPSADAGRALQQIGIDANTLRDAGLQEVFTILRRETGGATDQLARFLPNIRALSGAATLAGSSFDRFNSNLQETRAAAGATEEAFAKVAGNLSRSFGQLRSAVQDAFVSLGQVIAPAVQSAARSVREFVNNSRRDFDALAASVGERFGPVIEGFFSDLAGSASRGGSVVSNALRVAGDAVTEFGKLVSDSSEVLGVLVAGLQAVGQTAVLVAQSIRTVLGFAITSVGIAAQGLVTSLAELASAVGADGLAAELRVAEAATKAFTESVAGDTARAAEAAAEALSSFSEVGDTFERVRRTAEEAGVGLRNAGGAARLLASDVDRARNAQAQQVSTQQAATQALQETAQASRAAGQAQADLAKTTEDATAATDAYAASTAAAQTRAAQLFQEVERGERSLSSATAEIEAFRAATVRTRDVTASFADVLNQASTAVGENVLSAEQLTGVLQALGIQGAQAAQQTVRITTSARELFQAAALGVVSVEDATRALEGLAVAVQGVGTVTVQVRSALDLFNRAAADAFGGTAAEASSLSRTVSEAFSTIDTVLRGRFRESAEALVEQFGQGRTAAQEFSQAVQGLADLQGGFVDPRPLEEFVRQAGLGGAEIQRFSDNVLDSLRVVSNVLRGEFRQSADQLVTSFAQGRISSQEFQRSIEELAATQLGFQGVFAGLDELAGGLRRVQEEARAATSTLGRELRDSVDQASQEFQAGKISLDQYLDSILATGDQLRRFQGLTEEQLVSFTRLREQNGEVARSVLDLSRTLDRRLRPAFNTLLEAFRGGRLSAEQLGVGLGRLARQQQQLAGATRQTTGALRDNAAALNENAGATDVLSEGLTNAAVLQAEFFDQLQRGQQAIDETNAATQRYRTEGIERLLPKIEELRQRTNEAGRAQVDRLVRGFESAVISGAQLRQELQRVADATVNLGRAAQQTGQQVQQAFAGSNRLSAFGQPGSLQLTNRASGGSSSLGLQGRVTGSANFTSPLEAQLGQALGLAPKALRSRAQRSGGLFSLARQLGFDVDRFVDGGPINRTGPLIGEAGEFVLNQRGLSDLGRVLARALNQGSGGVSQTFNNSFNLTTPPAAQSDMRRLAFELTPELRRVGELAAARSPVS